RELVFGTPPAREPEDPSPDGERAAEARETVAWLEQEIHRLPVAQREALVLASLESRPLAEIAAALGLPVNTVKTHLRRAARAPRARREAGPAGRPAGRGTVMKGICRGVRQRLADEGPQALREDPAAQRHLEECSECFDVLEALARLDDALGAMSPVDAPDVVVKDLLARVEADPSAPPPPPPRPP